MSVVAEDFCGSSVHIKYKIKDQKLEECGSVDSKSKSSVKQFLQSAFLPEGYVEYI
jgi:hypothetical protein